MTTTPKFGIPLVASQQAQPEVPHNQMVLLIQSLIGGVIATQNAPPGSPASGDCYLVGTAGSGAWAGKNNKIAMYYGGWVFVPGLDSSGVDIPMGVTHEGLEVYDQGADARKRWSGTAWAALTSGGDPSITPFTTIPANPGWDPLYTGPAAAIVLSNSNKRATPASGSPYNHMMGTPANYAGKRYFEYVPGSTSFTAFGVTGPAGHFKNGDGNTFGNFLGQIGWNPGGTITAAKTGTSSFTLATIQTYAATNRLSVAVNLDADLIWFRTAAGNWNNNALNDPATNTGGIDLSWAFAGGGQHLLWPTGSGTNSTYDLFLKAADFTQAVPSGYAAWAT